MPGGRPSKYNEDTLRLSREYLVKYKNLGEKIPSVAGLAVYLGVRRETIWSWGIQDNKPEFSNLLDDLQAEQEKMLLTNGLSGDFNSTITKLVLTKHGYHEKKEVDHKGSFNINMPAEDADTL